MRFFEDYIQGNRKINPALLWDYSYVEADFQKHKNLIATRTVQIGKLEDFFAAFDTFGGIEPFRDYIKNNVVDLNPKQLNFMCFAFGFKEKETKCYKQMQLRKKHLHS